MKKGTIIILILSLIFVVSCKNEKKETEQKTEITSIKKYVVTAEATSVEWTAYKTTEKKPVSGKFNVLNFEDKSGDSALEALNNLSFSIPVSSIFSNKEERDAKLKKSFFEAMLDTEFLKGTLKQQNNSIVASITMNGITHDLPLNLKITNERQVTMTGTMLLKSWNALDALESLNKACFDLHKGPDGVSKTWDDVAINISTFLKEN